MRAVRLHATNSSLVLAEVPEPRAGANEVKVRIEACGICHSDSHYRAGFGSIATPRTLGHEIAGTVTEVGAEVRDVSVGDRVAIHYLLSCGTCRMCLRAGEQFCESGRMIGKECDGGYAETIVVPRENAIPIPPNVPVEVAAVMMCSTATAYHALRVGGVTAGTTVAVLGLGGLGISATHLTRVLGAGVTAAIDVVPEKLARAAALGAVPIQANGNVRDALLAATDGYGFDVAIDFTGAPEVSLPALKALAPRGTLVLVALSERTIPFNPYRDVLGKERRIVGCSDHLRSELHELMTLAGDGKLLLQEAISGRVPLDAGAINGVLDELERGTPALRSVVTADPRV
jgi:propanol-preferring alcohol dehydrogenase